MKYNTILKKISLLFLAITLTTSFVSCDNESDADISDVALDELGMRGTWVVDIDADGDNQAFSTISTYNSADNSTSTMWLDDQQHGWGLKAKVNVDPNSLTFSGTDLDELYYGVTVTITEGQIVRNNATTPTGDVVDSIYFKAEFSDLPGVIWEYYGYKSTAQVEDLP